ncbi:MAG: glycosyltransferase [Oscillospiraceae bacterium]|nr:glycosyltransferase [Oscillospiraceae bacterium]
MKLAFVAPANSVHTVRWVNAMARRGLEVTLFSLACHPARTGAIEPAVQICYLPCSGMAGYYTAAPRLRSALRRGGFDVVNAHYASGYGTLARLAGARPLLLNVWGSDVYEFPYQGRIKHTILLRNLRYADRIASTSHAMADQVRLLLGEPDREIPVTPFGVNIGDYAGEESAPREGPLTIGIVKSLAPVYAIDDLIRAFAIFTGRPEHAGARLLIYGDGPQRGELEELARTEGVADRVTFAGVIPNTDVPRALREMDIFALTSLQESFGVAAVEAMAAGLPVAATDVPGFREVIADGETGLIVPVRDPRAMAEALSKLADDPALRRTMGQAGRRRAAALFNWDSNVDAMLACYEGMIKG